MTRRDDAAAAAHTHMYATTTSTHYCCMILLLLLHDASEAYRHNSVFYDIATRSLNRKVGITGCTARRQAEAEIYHPNIML